MKKEEKEAKRGANKSVFLPAELYDRIEERVHATEFNSVEQYITFVLEEILKEEESKKEEPTFSKEDEFEVKKRLKVLGYLE
jgi:Arc/MetJ-type ribon-helix-helix transcriptional regulator